MWLITGATGHIGNVLVRKLLERGDKVRVLILPGESLESIQGLDVEAIEGDVLNLDSLFEPFRGARGVFHLAGVISIMPGSNEFIRRVNVEGTRNVLKACVSAGVRKFIYTSSGAAYGYYSDNAEWLTEDDPIRGNPEFAYSDHKRQVEEMLAEYRQAHPELKQLIFRCCTILGATAKNQITDLFDGKRVLGLAGCEIPFVLIWDMDVVGAILKGIIEENSSGIYNAAGDGILTMKEMAGIMGKPYVTVPPGLIKGALWIMKKLGVTQYGPEQVNFLRYRPVLSSKRLKEVFGYTPQKTTREVFQFFLECRKRGG